MKRLFGGKPAPAAANPPPAADADPRAASEQARAAVAQARAAIDDARAASRRIRRDHEPLAWAEARQLLGSALIEYAGTQTADAACSTYEEAESVLTEAIEIAGPDAHPGFLASMSNLAGYAAYRRGEQLDGDAKRRAYAAAADRFASGFAKITPESQRALWIDLGFYLGATLQALALLEDAKAAAGRLDEAAAAFRALVAHGTEDGGPHPIAAYNLHVVLQNRARLASGRAALPYLTEAREALLQAMASPSFEASHADHESRLAVLDAEIGAARK